jgi:hypothetical protein
MTTTSTRPRTPGWGSVVIGIAATFGVLISSAVVAVVFAGFLQWGPTLAPVLDNGIPLLVLVLGMLLCGRVAVDVAGRRGTITAVGTAVLVAVLGLAVSRSSDAHGDGIEPTQVAYATAAVLLLVGGSALLIQRGRVRRHG